MAEALKSPAAPVRSSFFLPMWFMPAKRRAALHDLYDFCRAVDDAVDEVDNSRQAFEGLNLWKRELDAVYHGTPTQAVSLRFKKTVRDYNVPKSALNDMLKGFEIDCADEVQLADGPALDDYCYRVAGCVGIASLAIFGVSITHYTPFAMTLGRALQITNILRDLDDDLAHGRCYIPVDLLAEHNLSPRHIEVGSKPAWDQAASVLAERAEEYFRKTHEMVDAADIKKLMPALLMRDSYHVLLTQMRGSGEYFQKATKVKRRPSDVANVLMKAVKYNFS